MSNSSWICIHCGTGIQSKCPGQRSEFYGFEVQMIKSVVTIDRIDDSRNNLSELFISYTADSKHTTAEQFRNLADMLTKDKVIEAMSCNHHWVMNSSTERTCCLDHDHHNLTDIDQIKADLDAHRKTRTVQQAVDDYARVARTLIDLARRELNISKPTFDLFVEAEFGYLKQYIGTAMAKLANGKSWRPLYRINTNGKYSWGDDATFAYFDHLDDATAYLRGVNRRMTLEKLDTERDAGYQPIEVDLTTVCTICGKHNFPDKDIIVSLPNGEAHLTCVNRAKNDLVVKKRFVTVRLGRIRSDLYMPIDRINKEHGLEDCYSYEDRRGNRSLRIFKRCDKAELDSIAESIRAQYAKGMH